MVIQTNIPIQVFNVILIGASEKYDFTDDQLKVLEKYSPMQNRNDLRNKLGQIKVDFYLKKA